MATQVNYSVQSNLPVKSNPNNGNGSSRTKKNARALYRHPTDKRVAGVCGGLGEYLNIDPVLIRLAWLFAALLSGGLALIPYFALWLVLPVGTQAKGQIEKAAIDLGEDAAAKTAYILIALGVLWLLANTGILPRVWGAFWAVAGVLFWPLLLIVAGYLLLRRSGRDASLAQDVKARAPDAESVKQSGLEARQRIPLRRSRDDRMLLGVCAGIARTLNIDPAIVRILWALFSIGSLGTGVILYIIAAIIMPEEEPGADIETVEGEVLDPVQPQS